jgi:hypothetical protein
MRERQIGLHGSTGITFGNTISAGHSRWPLFEPSWVNVSDAITLANRYYGSHEATNIIGKRLDELPLKVRETQGIELGG